jgi:hypothetical protein
MSNEQLGNSEYFDKLFQWANAGLWYVYPYVFIKKLQDQEFYAAVRSFPYHKFITKGTEMRRAQSIPLTGLFVASIWHQPMAHVPKVKLFWCNLT